MQKQRWKQLHWWAQIESSQPKIFAVIRGKNSDLHIHINPQTCPNKRAGISMLKVWPTPAVVAVPLSAVDQLIQHFARDEASFSPHSWGEVWQQIIHTGVVERLRSDHRGSNFWLTMLRQSCWVMFFLFFFLLFFPFFFFFFFLFLFLCTFYFVPFICTHARWELPWATQVFVAVLVWRLSGAN